MGKLAGGRHMADAETWPLAPSTHGPEARPRPARRKSAKSNAKRAREFDNKLGTPEGAGGPMTKEMKSCGSRVPVPVIGAVAEMPSDVGALADVTASALAADHIQFFSTSAAEAKGMCKQRIWTAWGHAAHRGWARPPA